MRPFVFSCDAHVVEPPELFNAGLPAEHYRWAPNSMVDDRGMRHIRLGDTTLIKSPADGWAHRVGDANGDRKRLGTRDLKARLADMRRDGVDGELVYPTLGLFVSRITDADASMLACQLYNEWVWNYLEGIRHLLVPAAIVPLVNVTDGIAELKRVVAKGFATVMMPCQLLDSCEKYNDPAWDEFFAIAAEAKMPLSFHTGVGNVNVRALKGPGGALFNYTRQINDAVDVIAALVGGGVLDRNPNAHITFAECGAGWLTGLAERMDEVYVGHAPMVEPKLSRMPSQIVRDQVHTAFQNDVGCLIDLPQLTTETFMFATDYPHAEGTFPFSNDVIDTVLASTFATDEQKAAILGLTAARMYKTSPELAREEMLAFAGS